LDQLLENEKRKLYEDNIIGTRGTIEGGVTYARKKRRYCHSYPVKTKGKLARSSRQCQRKIVIVEGVNL